jgi:orotidine-5'-phosphate decarboxylase
MSGTNANKDVIIALDFETGKKALTFLDLFTDEKPFVKIGMELFYADGPDIVREIKRRGHKIFLDLKLHDIPNTVRGGMKSLAGLGADMVNVHIAGGSAMMRAAKEGLGGGAGAGGSGSASAAYSAGATYVGATHSRGEAHDLSEEPLLIGVTQLTSTGQDVMREEILIDLPMEEVVLKYATNAKNAGLAGIVCSPLEVMPVHRLLGDDFLTVTPGIRFAGGEIGDQVRVTTPERARELGSDYIVVGRAITADKDPVSAYRRCVEGFLQPGCRGL